MFRDHFPPSTEEPLSLVSNWIKSAGGSKSPETGVSSLTQGLGLVGYSPGCAYELVIFPARFEDRKKQTPDFESTAADKRFKRAATTIAESAIMLTCLEARPGARRDFVLFLKLKSGYYQIR